MIMVIQPIVEGQGEEAAVPLLLRRLRDASQAWGLEVAKPHRNFRGRLAKKESLQQSVRLARLTPNCAGILVIFDADTICPGKEGPRLTEWAQEAAGDKPCALVLANREYEAWFLASIESLRGKARVLPDASYYADPESPRDAKGEIRRRMRGNAYAPTKDQEKLTAHFDLASAYKKSRSFRKLVAAFGALAAAAGVAPAVWPPTEWVSSE